MGFLIDTCLWVEVERGALSPEDIARLTGDEPVFMSPVTLAELRFGVEMAKDEEIRLRRKEALDRLHKKPCLMIDDETGHVFGRLAAELRVAGKDHQYRIQDLWLASQSIQYEMTLLTQNGKDFEDIPGLSLMVVPKM